MATPLFTFSLPEWLDEAPSTNTLLKDRFAASPTLPSGTVVAARRQTAGRGRMNAHWESASAGDITFSFFWSGRLPPLEAGTLPMACALGVTDFLGRDGWGIASQCKWPNDVLTPDGKIAGILTESGSAPGGGLGLVVGIGVNIRRLPGRDAALGRKTASVEDYAGTQSDVRELLPPLLAALQTRLQEWEKTGFAGIRRDLTARLWGTGKEIRVKTVHGPVHGVVAGLGDGGELLLKKPDGSVEYVTSVSAIENGW